MVSSPRVGCHHGGRRTATKSIGESAALSRVNNEKLLRQSAIEFTSAYDAYDTKAVAAQFATYAEMVNDDGSVIQGRAAIEKAFAEQFAAQPGCKMAVEIESLRFLGDDLAVEDGRLALTGLPKRPRCTVVIRSSMFERAANGSSPVHAKR